jgi:hypothetical protein
MGADLYIRDFQTEKEKEENRRLFNYWVNKRNQYFKYLPKEVQNVCDTWCDPDENELKRVKKQYPDAVKKANELQENVRKYYLLSSGGNGYFRCSYGMNFFGSMGFSWWQDFDLLLNDVGELSVDAAIDLVAILENNPIDHKLVANEWDEQREYYSYSDNTTIFEIIKRMNDHKQEFIDFLNIAIKLNKPIDCSI